jgi:CheY-like chemotaxis protein
MVGDSVRLRQVLVNLISNALKFTSRGEISLRVTARGLKPNEMELHFEVRDTGVGIPVDKQKLIFEAFAQADGSIARKFGGTGLGLTISSRLVEMMGGRMWVESEVGKGSCFHFTARMQNGSRASITDPLLIKLRGASALVIEDNPAVGQALMDSLSAIGMRVEVAWDGPSVTRALQRAHRESRAFKLFLVDADLPGSAGIDVANSCLEGRVRAESSLMVMVSPASPKEFWKDKGLGAVHYLAKPVGQIQLYAAIALSLGEDHPDAPSSVAHGEIPSRTTALRVLLAEDNRVNQMLGTRLLQKIGHSAVVAENGLHALAALEQNVFDLVLMDVQMPEMDGFQAVAAIRKKEETTGEHLPVIALTAHAMKGDEERCLAAGMDAYVAKPIQIQTLVAAIESVMSRTTAAPAV